jgi:peptidyl-prolyl cis-trans isomerase D
MLDIMRRKKRLKMVLWLVILSLALGMLLFFVPGVNMGTMTTETSAASVDGESIPMQSFSEAYRRVVNNYRNQGNNKIDPETLRAMGLPKQVLDGLVTQKVLEVAAKRLGIEVTPDEIRQAIETHPYLQDQGKFIGIERYKAVLLANSLSVTDFEESIRSSQISRKLREIITDALSVSDRELRDEFSRTNLQTVADYAILKKDDYIKRVKPTEADLRAYFDGHKDAYRIKERRRAQYLLVPFAQIIPTVSVTEEEIRTEFNQRPYKETVAAAHILFKINDPSKEAEVKAKAESVLKQVEAGGDFSALAKKYSEDTGSASQGGDLGPFQRGQTPKEFEDAAFSAKPGAIVLVRSEDGYHIIKVLAHNNPSLQETHDPIKLSLQQKKAREIAKLKAEQAAELALKKKDLNLIIKDLGVPAEIKETNLFNKDDNPFEFGISEALRNEVFELKEIGSIGKAIEHPLGYAVPKLLEVQMPKAGDFAQSRSQVEKDFIDYKAKELMQSDAKKLSEEATKQSSLEKAAKQMNLAVKASQPFNATGNPGPDLASNSSITQAAYDLPPGGVSAPLPLLDNLVVLQVKSRTPFDDAAYQKQKAELRQKTLQAIQEPYFQDYVRKITEDLTKAGKIRINPKALEGIPNSNY